MLAVISSAGAVASAQTTGALTANGSANADIRPEVAAFDSAWNILRTNYVAENNSHVDWDALKAELRPRAESARSVEEVRGVIRQMLERVGQSHFALLPASVASDMNGPPLTPGEVGSLGFNVGPVGGRLVVTGVDAKGPARAAGVKPGWVLTRVGNRDVSSAVGTLSDGASDHLKDFRLWALGTSLLRGRSGEGTELGFLDERDATVSKQIVRTPEAGVPVKFGHLPTLFARLDAKQVDRDGAAIGVIAFNVWMTAISRPFDEAIDRFRAAKGIVLDLRGNPGGVLTMIMGRVGSFSRRPREPRRDQDARVVAESRREPADGRRRGAGRRAIQRTGGDPRGLGLVQRVGDLRRRDAVHRPRAHLRHRARRAALFQPCSSGCPAATCSNTPSGISRRRPGSGSKAAASSRTRKSCPRGRRCSPDRTRCSTRPSTGSLTRSVTDAASLVIRHSSFIIRHSSFVPRPCWLLAATRRRPGRQAPAAQPLRRSRPRCRRRPKCCSAIAPRLAAMRR